MEVKETTITDIKEQLQECLDDMDWCESYQDQINSFNYVRDTIYNVLDYELFRGVKDE